MAILINSTISSETANSYASVAYADSYFESHYNATFTTTWDALDDSQKQMLLIQATLVLEQFRFVIPTTQSDYEMHYSRTTGLVGFYPLEQDPIKYNYFQALSFPRNLDVYSTTSQTYIPEPVLIAECEQAISIKNFSVTNINKVLSGIKSESVEIAGQISRAIVYQDGTTASNSIMTANLSSVAYQLLSPYILRNTRTKRA